MTQKNMTPDQEHAYYAEPDNHIPQGPPVRRRAQLSEPVPISLPEDTLTEVRKRAASDDLSVSTWIRRAIEHELKRGGS